MIENFSSGSPLRVNRVGGSHGRPTLSVRSTPNSDRKLRGLASVAKCQTQTSAKLFNHLVGATSSVSGTVRPSILAVSALMTSSNLVDCTTGRSAGLAPLRMRPA